MILSNHDVKSVTAVSTWGALHSAARFNKTLAVLLQRSNIITRSAISEERHHILPPLIVLPQKRSRLSRTKVDHRSEIIYFAYSTAFTFETPPRTGHNYNGSSLKPGNIATLTTRICVMFASEGSSLRDNMDTHEVPVPANQVYAINDTLSAEGAADNYETCLKQLIKNGVIASSPATGFPKFDLMLLGMGPDGHLASLFPGHPIVNENQKLVTYIKDSPKPPPERITFTFPVINSSAHVALVVTGAGKAGALHKALSNKQSSSDLLPVEMVELQDGEFTWFTDKLAVSMLSSI